MADVLDCALTGATAVTVMLVLANSADDDGTNCFPGTRLIAERTRVSERQVTRTIQKLESCGYLHVIVRGQGAGWKSEYRLNAERLHEEALKTQAERKAKRRHGVTFSRREKKVTLAAKKGDTGNRKGDIDAAPLFVLPVSDSEEALIHPQPLAREGRVEMEIANAVDQVCSALAIANRRKRRLLRDVIALEVEKGELPATVAKAMIRAWNGQAEHGRFLRVKLGLAKFFGEGVWKDSNRWHWDQEALRRDAQASVGSR